jgi:hypothetical protein
MKLELKHIVGYLPYGLKFKYCDVMSHENDYIGECNYRSGEFQCVLNYSEYFPILRPLSDLVKVIEVDGEKFTPIKELARIEDNGYHKCLAMFYNLDAEVTNKRIMISWIDNEIRNLILKYDCIRNSFSLKVGGVDVEMINTYELYQKLHEWHFDIHGLIDMGLAIDINKI